MINMCYRAKCIKQSGAALIITMVSLLLICSLITLSNISAITSQTRTERHIRYAEQAFEAAESDIEYGIAYLKNNQAAILNNNIEKYTISETTNVNNGNDSYYSISYHSPITGDYRLTEVLATGLSNNGKTQKQLSILAERQSYIKNTPQAGFITHLGTDIGGNITISNYVNDNTIWSGGPVILSGAAQTQASGGISSNHSKLDTDIHANDLQLSSLRSDAFFQQMIGVPRTYAKEKAGFQLSYDLNTNLSLILSDDRYLGKALWIDQTAGTAFLSGTSTIGRPEKPVILIINGNFLANGTTDIYGIVYVSQDRENTGGGTLNVHGAIIVEGHYLGFGTPNINYDPDVLANLNYISEFAKVPGSWVDF